MDYNHNNSIKNCQLFFFILFSVGFMDTGKNTVQFLPPNWSLVYSSYTKYCDV